jgi:hypothetical protein
LAKFSNDQFILCVGVPLTWPISFPIIAIGAVVFAILWASSSLSDFLLRRHK